jgi:ABC-2 type transport system permease protein
VLTKRPVAVGLVYIMLWENVLVSFVDGARVFSVREHATTLADTVGNTPLLDSTVSLSTALVMAVLFVVVGTVGATQRLRSFALTGEAN